MIAGGMAGVAACVGLASHGYALDNICDSIKNFAGIYYVYPGDQPVRLGGRNQLTYSTNAKIYIVPDRTKRRDETVWHVRLATTAIEGKKLQKLKLARNTVNSVCKQRVKLNRSRDWEGETDVVSYDNFANNYNRVDQNLNVWHFSAGSPSCYNTEDVIQPVVAVDRQRLQRDFEISQNFTSTAVAETTARLSRIADVTSVLVFKRLGDQVCFSFNVPRAPSSGLFGLGGAKWTPKSTSLEFWRLPHRKMRREITIAWRKN
jgi:hypothetical protein